MCARRCSAARTADTVAQGGRFEPSLSAEFATLAEPDLPEVANTLGPSHAHSRRLCPNHSAVAPHCGSEHRPRPLPASLAVAHRSVSSSVCARAPGSRGLEPLYNVIFSLCAAGPVSLTKLLETRRQRQLTRLLKGVPIEPHPQPAQSRPLKSRPRPPAVPPTASPPASPPALSAPRRRGAAPAVPSARVPGGG